MGKGTIPRRTIPSLPVAYTRGRVVADGQDEFSSIQTALDSAADSIIIGPGTFNENVTVTTDDLTIRGAGRATRINGAADGNALTIDATGVRVENVNVLTDINVGNSLKGVYLGTSSDACEIKSVVVEQSDGKGFHADGQSGTGDDNDFINCRVIGSQDDAFATESVCAGNHFDGCRVFDVGGRGFLLNGDDNVVEECSVSDPSGNGIEVVGNDCIVGSTRVDQAGGDGVVVTGSNDSLLGVTVSNSTGSPYDLSAATNPIVEGCLPAVDNISMWPHNGPMADDGTFHSTIQSAVDASSSLVYVPEGTYNENVTMSSARMTIVGASWDTVISGGSSEAILCDQNEGTIKNLTAESTDHFALDIGGDLCQVSRVRVSDAGSSGINGDGYALDVLGCNIENTSNEGVQVDNNEATVANTVIDSPGSGVWVNAGMSHTSVVNCRIISPSNHGCMMRGSENKVLGCIVRGATNSGVIDEGTNDLAAANIVKNCGSGVVTTDATNPTTGLNVVV